MPKIASSGALSFVAARLSAATGPLELAADGADVRPGGQIEEKMASKMNHYTKHGVSGKWL